jgi:hypothetical protein
LFALFATGVADTGGKFAASVVDTGVWLTPAAKLPPVSLTPCGKFAIGITTPAVLVAKLAAGVG